jgi:hypothetical protein
MFWLPKLDPFVVGLSVGRIKAGFVKNIGKNKIKFGEFKILKYMNLSR